MFRSDRECRQSLSRTPSWKNEKIVDPLLGKAGSNEFDRDAQIFTGVRVSKDEQVLERDSTLGLPGGKQVAQAGSLKIPIHDKYRVAAGLASEVTRECDSCRSTGPLPP